ncbi:MAG: ArsR/SmtB family transcription factor [Janthinobacterium lividum]
MSKRKDKAVEAEVPTDAAGNRAMLLISRALADPRRVDVFRRIASAETTPCMQLRECLAINPATLSHHMKQLEACGLIETVREGKFVRASVRRKVWKGYLAYLKGLAI